MAQEKLMELNRKFFTVGRDYELQGGILSERARLPLLNPGLQPTWATE
jgi:hypothetical protein